MSACCAFRLEADELVGGGVCIDPAKFVACSGEGSRPVFSGVIEGSFGLKRRRLNSEATDGLGDDDSWRDGSTGGSGRPVLDDR